VGKFDNVAKFGGRQQFFRQPENSAAAHARTAKVGNTPLVRLDNYSARANVGDDNIVHPGKEHPAGANRFYLVNSVSGNTKDIAFYFGRTHAGNFNPFNNVHGDFVFKNNFAQRAGRGGYRVERFCFYLADQFAVFNRNRFGSGRANVNADNHAAPHSDGG